MRLKPCPFCGEKYDIALRFRTYNGGAKEIIGHTYAYVECLPCDVKTGHCFECDADWYGYKSAKHMAIDRWNTRVSDKPDHPGTDPEPPDYEKLPF